VRILLLAPYYGGSHRAWAEGYAAHSRHDVAVLPLAARFWKWRMQGGAVTLAERARDLTRARGRRADLLLATDMLNLPAFLALTRDFLSDVPAVLYCHENQLTYPVPPGEKRDLTYGMINWLSMLAADRVFFNSEYHLEDWFQALPNMLKHFPDYSHLHRVEEVRAKASVLPVGCDLQRLDDVPRRSRPDAPPLILWNQRWEYDKNPGAFFRALYRLAESGAEFRVAIAGRSHRQSAPEFEAARERLGERVVHFGHAEEGAYEELLREADIVVSTAIHEFFGIAVVEAIYAGCFPILPDRLSYPELIPEPLHGECLFEDVDELIHRLRWAVDNPAALDDAGEHLRVVMRVYDWSRLAPQYDDRLGGR
jgi:glycosyltransferase involved in cell wall biosynthesis